MNIGGNLHIDGMPQKMMLQMNSSILCCALSRLGFLGTQGITSLARLALVTLRVCAVFFTLGLLEGILISVTGDRIEILAKAFKDPIQAIS